MALARVVEFDGVNSDRMQEMQREMEGGQPPEGMPPAEILVLHDPNEQKSLVVLLLDSEDDYQRADEVLQAIPAEDTPGRRTSVRKYEVAARMSA